MPWIRLSDDYLGDEKIAALSLGAFKFWHEGLAYCRRQRTDGLIPFTIMRQLPAYNRGREKELATPLRDGMDPLWELIPHFGYKVHNYLKWNPSREVEDERRNESKERMRELRSRRVTASPPPLLQRNSVRTSHEVLGQGKELDLPGKGCGENPSESALLERAGRLRQDLYPAWYAKHRHGAKLRLIENYQDFQDALSLVRTWDDARLEKLARIILTTNEDFIARTDRGFHIFAIKASWADDRLRQEEHRSA